MFELKKNKVFGTYFKITEVEDLAVHVQAAILKHVPIGSSERHIEEFLKSCGIDQYLSENHIWKTSDVLHCRCFEVSENGRRRFQYDLIFSTQIPKGKNDYISNLADVHTAVRISRGFADRQAGDVLREYFCIPDTTPITEESIRTGILEVLPLKTADYLIRKYLEARGIKEGAGNRIKSTETALYIRAMDPMMGPDSFHIKLAFPQGRLLSVTVEKKSTIHALTSIQETQADQMAIDWRAQSLSTSATDREETAQAVFDFYQLFRQKEPTIVWCESPFQLMLLPLIIKRLSLDESPDINALRARLSPRLAAGFDSRSWPRIEESLWTLVEKQVSDRLHLIFGAENYSAFAPTANHSEMDCASQLLELKKLRYRVIEQLAESSETRITKEVLNKLNQQFGKQRGTDLWPEIKNLIHQTSVTLRRQCAGLTGIGFDESSFWWGRWDCQQFLLYQYIRQYFDNDFFNAKLDNKFMVWMNLHRGGIAYRFFKDVCFVCLQPESLHWDDRSVLHHDKTSAMQFPDGYSIHAWHGVAVPAYVIEQPELITIQDIESEPNVEVRRVKILRYGGDDGEVRYLQDSRAQIIDKSSYGTLLREERWNEPLVTLRLVNSTVEPDGSHKVYYLRVPPDMISAREAVAWTFGMTSDEYGPLVET